MYGYVYIFAIRKFLKASCDVMAITTVISPERQNKCKFQGRSRRKIFETKNVCCVFYFVLARFYFAFSPSVCCARDFDRNSVHPADASILPSYVVYKLRTRALLKLLLSLSYPSRPKLVNHVQRKSKGFCVKHCMKSCVQKPHHFYCIDLIARHVSMHNFHVRKHNRHVPFFLKRSFKIPF